MTGTDEILRTAKARRDRAIKFAGTTEDGIAVEWYVAYRGKFGWSACRANGEWLDEPSEQDVNAALEKYETVELVDRTETPEVVEI